MKLNKDRIREYMLADGSVSGCFISPEESARIARLEGITFSGTTSTKHNLNIKNNKMLPKSEKSTSKISTSYIIVTCDDDADPKFNRLQLRTDPPTFIELQSGRNILTVKAYPALRHGFSQIDDVDDDKHLHLNDKESLYPGENCQDVIEIDFSHFDGSEIESMDYMFHFMSGIEKLTFGNMKTPKLRSAERAFWGIGALSNNEPILDLDLSGLDFSKVTNASEMFSDATIRTLNLSGCNFENINDFGTDILGEISVKHLILDNCKFRTVDDWNPWSDYRGLMDVSLKGWKKDDCRDFIIAMESGRSRFIGSRYILDSIYKYRIGKDTDNNVTCEISIKKEFSFEMEDLSKKEAIDKWLEANPGKTKRDWLIEVRCTTNEQRNALNEILDQCDEHGISYEIGLEVNIPGEYRKYLSESSGGISFVGETPMVGETPVDFNSYNSCLELKFKETKIFDIFFPSLGWYINIGEEINDAVERLKGGLIWNDDRLSNEDISSNIGDSLLRSLNTGFNRYLKDKYKLPIEKLRDKYDKPKLIPWNHDLEKSECTNRLFEIDTVSSFIYSLFKENYSNVIEQIVANRKEKFFSLNPEIKKQRAEMLHTIVIGIQREKGIGNSLSVDHIKKLLKTVDNELSVLYPEYDKLRVL